MCAESGGSGTRVSGRCHLHCPESSLSSVVFYLCLSMVIRTCYPTLRATLAVVVVADGGSARGRYLFQGVWAGLAVTWREYGSS